MKKAILIIALYGVCTMAMDSCKKQNSNPTTPSCSVNGTTVNIGGSAGGSYFVLLGSSGSSTYDYLYFDNTDLNFYLYETVNGFNAGGSYIMDVGQQSCPGFSYSGTPNAALVAYKKGEGYAGVFKDGHSVKFITTSYSGGIALISYVYQ